VYKGREVKADYKVEGMGEFISENENYVDNITKSENLE
jgi:hypothetical protein